MRRNFTVTAHACLLAPRPGGGKVRDPAWERGCSWLLHIP